MALSHIGPTIWSKTPETIMPTKNLNSFKHNIKEHFLKELKNSILVTSFQPQSIFHLIYTVDSLLNGHAN